MKMLKNEDDTTEHQIASFKDGTIAGLLNYMNELRMKTLQLGYISSQ